LALLLLLLLLMLLLLLLLLLLVVRKVTGLVARGSLACAAAQGEAAEDVEATDFCQAIGDEDGEGERGRPWDGACEGAWDGTSVMLATDFEVAMGGPRFVDPPM